jgi:UDP-N-acetylglucosamine 2-epimerase
MKAASIVDAKPNFFKLAPISRVIHGKLDEMITHNEQHYNNEMDKIIRQARNFEPFKRQYDVFGRGDASLRTTELIGELVLVSPEVGGVS